MQSAQSTRMKREEGGLEDSTRAFIGGMRLRNDWPPHVFVCWLSPKMDVSRAPVLDATICCVGEMAAGGSLAARSPILTVCQTKNTAAEPGKSTKLPDIPTFIQALFQMPKAQKPNMKNVIQNLNESIWKGDSPQNHSIRFSWFKVTPEWLWRGAAVKGRWASVMITYQRRAGRHAAELPRQKLFSNCIHGKTQWVELNMMGFSEQSALTVQHFFLDLADIFCCSGLFTLVWLFKFVTFLSCENKKTKQKNTHGVKGEC